MCNQHARKQGGQQEGGGAVTDAAKGNTAVHPVGDVIRFNQLGTLIPAISARILKASAESLDTVIQTSLREVICSLGLERGGLFEASREKGTVSFSHVWFDRSSGSDLLARGVNLAEHHPWTYHQVVVLGKTVAKTTIDSIPPEAEADREAFIRFGAKSSLAIPLFIGAEVRHIIAVHSLKETHVWPESFHQNLRLLGEIFVSALDRRTMLKSLEQVRARLDLAASSAGAALWELDLTTGIFWTNKIARGMFHMTDEEPITFHRVLERIHPEDRAAVTEAVEAARQARMELNIEYRLPEANGAIRWMISRGRIRENGNGAVSCLSGVTLEITRQKQMECKLQEQVREISRLRELLELENTMLRSEAGLGENKHGALGSSAAMQGVKSLVDQVAATDSTVLIQGETGTGKELIALAIHQLSGRSNRLMISVNCAALPSALIESELFGREKGAFTGALSRQAGRFEVAHGSTLLLDEIAEMPLEIQAKLLRVLQNGSFERLGSPRSIQVDVRIIAATNRDLAEEVERGRFRRDLFYRLNVFPIHVPPLRERTEDIPQMVWKFIGEFGQKMGKKIKTIAPEDMTLLMACPWPGNVRELRNVVERAMIASTGSQLEVKNLALALPRDPSRQAGILTLEEVERRHIQETIKATGGRIKGRGGAAELLGLHPSTLYSRMRKLAIGSSST